LVPRFFRRTREARYIVDRIMNTDPSTLRERMVEEQLAARGLRDGRVLAAMRKVPREKFVRAELAEHAYRDAPLPIESGQTISQPFMVAFMAACLKLQGGEKLLEVGCGSGYAAAVLAEIAAEVFAVERHQELAEIAAARLKALGYENVKVRQGDGTLGWPENAPYDGILVSAGSPEVPPALQSQLALGGRLLIPVGPTTRGQQLLRITRTGEESFEREELLPVAFVPLIGEQGWKESEAPSFQAPRFKKETP
jgi:protein-L-isoaspartate(D-aspartate) O-methyltransferase